MNWSSIEHVLLLVALPLVWGLGVEYIFERIRRARKVGASRRQEKE